MNVGLVWPMPGPEAVIDAGLANLIVTAREGTGATHLRFDVDYRHPDPCGLVRAVIDCGFEPLPILTFHPYDHEPDLPAFVTFAERLVQECQLNEVEILNEPRVMGQWDGARYGRFARPVCEALAGAPTRVLIAGDYMQPDREGPKIFPAWFDDVRAEVPDRLYDVVAWHTYREPAAPDTTRYHDRAEEYLSMRRPLPADVPVQVTEVGWNLVGVTFAEQALCIRRELEINRTLGIEATYLFAPIPGNAAAGDFGFFNHDWSPRPSADAIKAFQTARDGEP